MNAFFPFINHMWVNLISHPYTPTINLKWSIKKSSWILMSYMSFLWRTAAPERLTAAAAVNAAGETNATTPEFKESGQTWRCAFHQLVNVVEVKRNQYVHT